MNSYNVYQKKQKEKEREEEVEKTGASKDENLERWREKWSGGEKWTKQVI